MLIPTITVPNFEVVLMDPAYIDHNVPAGPPPVISDRKSIGHGRSDCAPVAAISSIAAAR
jgi:hypothetical protein